MFVNKYGIIFILILSCYSQLCKSNYLKGSGLGNSLLKTQDANSNAKQYEHIVASKELRGDKYPSVSAGYVGMGYDIFKGNPEGNPSARTMVDPGFRIGVVDAEYSQEYLTVGMTKLRPKYGYARKETACQMAKQITTETTMGDYTDTLNIDANGGVDMPGLQFSLSGGYKEMKQDVVNNKVERNVMKSYCLVYRSGVDPDMPLKVTSAFAASVDKLKKKDTNGFSEQDWYTFFGRFGTHFLNDVHFGGKQVNIMMMRSEDVTKLRNEGINAAVSGSANFGAVKISGGASVATDEKKKEKFNKMESCYQQLSLGGSPHETFSDWASTVPDSPMPVKYDMAGFHRLNIFKTKGLVDTYNYMVRQYNLMAEEVVQGMAPDLTKPEEHSEVMDDVLLPGTSKASTPGADEIVNGGGCGMLKGKVPKKSSLSAGTGTNTKKLSIGNDGNLRITADYGSGDTVWDNEISVEVAKYRLEYTNKNDLLIYHNDLNEENAIWTTGTSACSKEPAFTRLARDGVLEVWGLSERGNLELYWYSWKGYGNGLHRCASKTNDYCKNVDPMNKAKVNHCKHDKEDKAVEQEKETQLVVDRQKKSQAFADDIKNKDEMLKKRMKELKDLFAMNEGEKARQKRAKDWPAGGSCACFFHNNPGKYHEYNNNCNKALEAYRSNRKAYDAMGTACDSRSRLSLNTRYTPGNKGSSKKGSQYLDRHDVRCPHGRGLNSFQLQVSNDIKYKYTCMRGPGVSSNRNGVKQTTMTGRGKGDMTYLGQHNLDCNGRPIVQFKLKQLSGNLQYDYTCGGGMAVGHCDGYSGSKQSRTKNLNYFNRHAVKCASDRYLSRFQLMHGGNNQQWYDFTCCKIHKDTKCTQRDGNCAPKLESFEGRKYIGCYKDSGDRDLPINIGGGSRGYTISTCFQECYAKSQKYYALQSSGQCFCGNSYGKHGKKDRCTPCQDSKKLGGSWTNCIFSTGV